MKTLLLIPVLLLNMLPVPARAQNPDTSAVPALLKKQPDASIVTQDTVKEPLRITMPAYRGVPVRNNTFRLDAGMRTRAGDIKYDNPTDRLQKPPAGDIKIFPEHPMPPGALKMPDAEPLKLQDYTLPTKDEYEVLRILWLKEDVMDTTIYSCVDSSMNVTYSGLSRILDDMTRKGLVVRQQVSPRFEFNAFGVPIEMSRKNIRNKVYAYHSLVDREKLKHFIDAAQYEVSQDPDALKQRKLKAAQQDAGLLDSLNRKSLMDSRR
jgi:predicted transcriptional regulator